VDVRRNYDAALPPVNLDRARFTQVAINLILNAMQAMPGGGLLTVRTRQERGGKPMAVVEFDDTGTGVRNSCA
jgi:signal transduction histidine kinase